MELVFFVVFFLKKKNIFLPSRVKENAVFGPRNIEEVYTTNEYINYCVDCVEYLLNHCFVNCSIA